MPASSSSDEDLLDASLFVNLETRLETLNFGRLSVTLEVSTSACTDHDLTGQLAWPGARLLCAWLAEQPAECFAACAVELGSGTGLAGLAYAARGGAVTLTDYQPVVLDLLARNAERSAVAAAGSCAVAKLFWGDAEDEAQLRARSPDGTGYPVLLGADILYPGSAAYLPGLMQSVVALLAPGGVLYLCYCSRAATTDRALFSALEAAGLVAREAPGGGSRAEGGVCGTVYAIRRRGEAAGAGEGEVCAEYAP